MKEREKSTGTCEHCRGTFGYYLIHNGFNESTYAYCAACGMTAILDTNYRDRAMEGLPMHRAITAGGERFLTACSCGGTFEVGASPRCPRCRGFLSATVAAGYIEANAPGARSGWRWQKDWQGLYCIVVENRCMMNPWKVQ